jgi:hypothetical protein
MWLEGRIFMEATIERVDFYIDPRKAYEKPEIIHELELETRAGSPYPTVFFSDPLDNDQ